MPTECLPKGRSGRNKHHLNSNSFQIFNTHVKIYQGSGSTNDFNCSKGREVNLKYEYSGHKKCSNCDVLQDRQDFLLWPWG